MCRKLKKNESILTGLMFKPYSFSYFIFLVLYNCLYRCSGILPFNWYQINLYMTIKSINIIRKYILNVSKMKEKWINSNKSYI